MSAQKHLGMEMPTPVVNRGRLVSVHEPFLSLLGDVGERGFVDQQMDRLWRLDLTDGLRNYTQRYCE